MTYSAVTLRSGGTTTVSASPLKSISDANTMLASAARDSTACTASPAFSAIAVGVTETPAPSRTSAECSRHADCGSQKTTLTFAPRQVIEVLDTGGVADRHDDRHRV